MTSCLRVRRGHATQQNKKKLGNGEWIFYTRGYRCAACLQLLNLSAEFTACKNNRRQQTTAGVDVQALIFLFCFLSPVHALSTRGILHRTATRICTFLSFGGLVDRSFASLPTGRKTRTRREEGKQKPVMSCHAQGDGTKETRQPLTNRAAAASPAATRCSRRRRRRRRGPSRCPRPRRRRRPPPPDDSDAARSRKAAWAAARRHTRSASAARRTPPAAPCVAATASGRC